MTRRRLESEEARTLRLFIQLTRATERVAAGLQPALGTIGLTAGQLGVLEALTREGPMSLRALGSILYRSPPNMTTVVDNLERDGLVLRERSADDRRVVLVSTTVEGKRRLERAFPTYARIIAEFMSALAPGEQDQLGRLCAKLRDAPAVDEPPQPATPRVARVRA